MATSSYSQKRFQQLLLVFSCAFMVVSCTKDDSVIANKSLLFGKKWYLVSATINEKGQDVSDNIPACTQDDYMEFNADQTYDYIYGSVKCTESEPDNARQTASWNLENNTLTLAPMTFEVMKLSPGELNLKIELQGTSGKAISKRYYIAK